jgi:signal transduction histidine kinase
VKLNVRKIEEHGRRGDGIVRSMLEHSRATKGERTQVNVNALLEEYLNLAYHSMRAQDADFKVTLEKEFDTSVRPIDLVPQEIGRVILNLFNNAFYAVHKRGKAEGDGYAPTIKVSTRIDEGMLEIRVEDNGQGMSEETRGKVFEPFFTTKPTGEGTGLGLSLSFEIITRGYGGTLSVESREGAGATFFVRLPVSG